MEVSFNEYFSRLVDQAALNIACMATVKDTQYEYFAQDDFRCRKPDIKISMIGTPTAGQPLEIKLKLENPLPIPLKKGLFLVEGPGLPEQLKIKLKENVASETFAEASFTLTPEYSGRTSIVAKFTSKEMDDVDGFLAFAVQPAKETAPEGTNGTS